MSKATTVETTREMWGQQIKMNAAQVYEERCAYITFFKVKPK